VRSGFNNEPYLYQNAWYSSALCVKKDWPPTHHVSISLSGVVLTKHGSSATGHRSTHFFLLGVNSGVSPRNPPYCHWRLNQGEAVCRGDR
jgi:hypothetical protein